MIDCCQLKTNINMNQNIKVKIDQIDSPDESLKIPEKSKKIQSLVNSGLAGISSSVSKVLNGIKSFNLLDTIGVTTDFEIVNPEEYENATQIVNSFSTSNAGNMAKEAYKAKLLSDINKSSDTDSQKALKLHEEINSIDSIDFADPNNPILLEIQRIKQEFPKEYANISAEIKDGFEAYIQAIDKIEKANQAIVHESSDQSEFGFVNDSILLTEQANYDAYGDDNFGGISHIDQEVGPIIAGDLFHQETVETSIIPNPNPKIQKIGTVIPASNSNKLKIAITPGN